jgi:hypothetical protein
MDLLICCMIAGVHYFQRIPFNRNNQINCVILYKLGISIVSEITATILTSKEEYF